MTDRIHEFSNDGLTFPVTDEGPLDGDVVVLLHGFPQTSTSWNAVCDRLHAEGYRTLTFDQRGYAPTARPRGRRAYRMSRLVSDVAALVGATGGPVHLVGHDWGAAVAWSTAAGRPDLVRSLVAVSVPHPRAFLGSMLISSQILRSYYIGLFQLPWLPEFACRRPRLLARMLSGTGMTPEQIAAVRTEIVDRAALTPSLNWYRAMPFSHPRYLRPVEAPTTYVWTTGDTALGRRGATMCSRYVTGPYRLDVAGGSHWVPEEQPDLLTRAIVDRISS
ncbi:alpha/beta fold hydrolase [Mycobacterium yunnanensis]|uniref:Alpha/beta fold hydrolase n=1 Tax=Mycobacterium yunnanensis TaxID=368477 RepID=A0A9X2YXK8_9MYCO|nr:alpha/beta fold hydrolase [Mycobacterium yunnanensis]MCV7419566.1 alpha/beta fold hydrolase [Mycobacterium yunnanensis]